MQKVIIYSSSLCSAALLEGLLYDCGVELFVTNSCQELFDRCAQEAFDKVVIGDVRLFTNGSDAVRRIRPGGATRPQIFVLAPDITEESVTALLECGVNQYISLPVSPARLRRKVFEI